MEGLKEAIEFITNLKEGSMEPKVLEINGNTYCNKNLTRYHYFPKADSLSVNTLTSIVDYIKGKPEELRETMILHVISPTEVRLYSGLVDERNREELMRADAIVNEFRFDRYYDQEVDKTATEVLVSKTRKYNRVTAIQGKLEECLNGFVTALAFYNGSYMSGVEFTCEFNDSILADEESERQQDRQDVSMGVMSLLEYRMKWYNEDEETAKAKLPEQNQVME